MENVGRSSVLYPAHEIEVDSTYQVPTDAEITYVYLRFLQQRRLMKWPTNAEMDYFWNVFLLVQPGILGWKEPEEVNEEEMMYLWRALDTFIADHSKLQSFKSPTGKQKDHLWRVLHEASQYSLMLEEREGGGITFLSRQTKRKEYPSQELQPTSRKRFCSGNSSRDQMSKDKKVLVLSSSITDGERYDLDKNRENLSRTNYPKKTRAFLDDIFVLEIYSNYMGDLIPDEAIDRDQIMSNFLQTHHQIFG